MRFKCYKIEHDGGSYSKREWFDLSIREFKVPSSSIEEWDYVQIVPLSSLRSWYSGNDGSQGWRHRRTGFTIPDYCRQTRGYPEIWGQEEAEESEDLEVSEDSPILRGYIIVH